jgi:hypothetical protein
MNTNKDKEFKNVENLKWLPFVGQNFFNSPNENKMLIVGESHYHDKSEESILKHDNPLYTRIVIILLGYKNFSEFS